MKTKSAFLFLGILLVTGIILTGCGGGGGGGSKAPTPPTSQTGGAQGYVYIPIGASRVAGDEKSTMRAANAAPAGYVVLSGATVTCGGKSATTNSSGYYSISGIAVGSQTVTISKTGYQSIQITVTITANVTVTVSADGSTTGVLNPTDSGSIYVTSTPSGATIFIDGQNTTFTTPRTFTNIKSGSHQVYVTLSGYTTPTTQTVTVTTGGTANASFTLSAGGGISVTASVSPTSGTTATTFTLTCTVSGGTTTSLEGRCNTTDSWATISSGNTKSCVYSTTGTYTPGCRVNSSIINNVSSSVTVTSGASSTNQIAAGWYHACALTSPGGVKCWGQNIYSQLGDGTATTRTSPVDVIGLSSGVSAITTGEEFACALTTSGGVKCWGYNSNGQLGDGTTTNRNTPVDVTGLSSGVIAISAGRYHTCAITSGGGVKCWGSNNYGELGNGTTGNSFTPVDVSGLTSGVMAISAGYHFTCAVTNSGGAKCWGVNGGQLGDGTTTQRLTPVDVSGLSTGVTSIATGFAHACARNDNGGIKCWGNNGNGQLGDGTTTNRLTPVDVSGLTSGATAITTGWLYFTCAATNSSGVKCWGDNQYGQLGDGTTTIRLTPVNVNGF